MNILVLGGGGREHAIIKALKTSKKVKNLSCAPGNPGIARDAACHIADPTDMRTVIDLAKRIKPDLVIIGPEAPLASGVADALRRFEYKVVGPNQKEAQLESSKIFAKEFMQKYSIPTANYKVVNSKDEMVLAQTSFSGPWVVKADGLAGGKGVRICENDSEFKKAATDFFEKKVLQEASNKVILEEFIQGQELSVLLLVSGDKYQILPFAQDYKKLHDENKGPNTGGMGAYAPVKSWGKILKKVEEKIIKPTMKGFNESHFDYRGILYIGLMIKDGEPYVLEYNVRFGDPEAQVIMPLLQGDWVDVFKQIADGKMPKLNWNKNSAVCVVVAAPGYPDNPQKGLRVFIDKEILKQTNKEKYFLHAGTASHNGYITSGGRVLNCIGIDKTVTQARAKAYEIVKGVILNGLQVRNDIAKEVSSEKVSKVKKSKAPVKALPKKAKSKLKKNSKIAKRTFSKADLTTSN
ncbi:MAG: phosphoribosylamine--glycine ligase [Oligoflexia bacterium]|nr:phosphoribosylamine--glycine ligase [Oligoflexia bacterium]